MRLLMTAIALGLLLASDLFVVIDIFFTRLFFPLETK